jgi:hypothetical protein
MPYWIDAGVAKIRRSTYQVDVIITSWADGAMPKTNEPWSMQYAIPKDRPF